VSSGFSLGGLFQDGTGRGNGRPGRLDDGVTAPFFQDVPGLAEIDLVWFFSGDAHGAALVELGLAPAVVLGDQPSGSADRR
jgi:hypothetical protein